VKRVLPAVLLALTVIIIYGPLAQYGYVHDDRVLIRDFDASGVPDLSPMGKTFYRPLGILYCYTVYSVFGTNAAGFHILAMLLLFGTALAVRFVALALTNDDGVSWGSAFLYAAAAHLHLDAQMWMVGIFDNGAVLFTLLCLLGFLRGRMVLAAAWFACALGFKESAAPIMTVLAVAALLVRPGGKDLVRMWPLAVVVTLWGIVKALGGSAAGLPVDDPYAWSIAGWHIIGNVGLYLSWFAPAPLATIVIAILAGWGCFMKPRIGWFLVLWAILMLMPPAILLHHGYRYYANLALPAVAIGVMMGLFAFPVSTSWKRGLATILVLVNILNGVLFIQGHVRRGINDDLPAKDDGYNHLIRRSLQGE
jgi:hypothetical protein